MLKMRSVSAILLIVHMVGLVLAQLPQTTVDEKSCIVTRSNYTESIAKYGFCEQYTTANAEFCGDLLTDGMYIFVPHERISLENILTVEQKTFSLLNPIVNLNSSLSTDSKIDCIEAGRQIFCHYLFIPCGVDTEPGLPRPLCMDECLTFSEADCKIVWEVGMMLLNDALGNVGELNCCNLTQLIGPVHNCCQSLKEYNGQSLSPSYEVCSPSTSTSTPETSTVIGVAVGTVVLLVAITLSVLGIVIFVVLRRKRSRNRQEKQKQKEKQQAVEEGDGAGVRVQTVHRREIESHNLLIPLHSLKLQHIIGEGEFGTVQKGLLKRPQQSIAVAVKKLKSVSSVSQVEVDKFVEESLKMKEFHHPNVISLHGICLEDPASPMIVMPYMENGALLGYLRSKRQQRERVVRMGRDSYVVTECGLLSVCRQIARGMEYLAELRFVHRDLAARNCMIDASFTVKVADFGLSRDIYSRNYYHGGRAEKVPARWMPVEALVDGLWSEKSDIWAYGVTCWEIFMFGYTPYPGVDIFSIVSHLKDGHRLSKPDTCSHEMYSVMLECWAGRAEDRPTFSQVAVSVESLLGSKAGYTDLNMHSALEAALQLDSQQDSSSTQDLHQDSSSTQDLHQDSSSTQHLHQDSSSTQDLHQDSSSTQDLHQDSSSTQHLHQDSSSTQHLHQDSSSTQHLHQDSSSTQHLHQDSSSTQHLIQVFEKLQSSSATLAPDTQLNINDEAGYVIP